MIYLILWRSSITSILQCKRAILIGECVRGSFSCPFTFPPTSTTMPDMAAGMCIKWETEIHYTVATRSFSLFDRKHDTTSKQLLISKENNHWIRMPKSKAVLEDSLLTMMQSLSGHWEGLTKSEIYIPYCKCATLDNSTMSINTHGLPRSYNQNHARQMLLQFWRMTASTSLILY